MHEAYNFISILIQLSTNLNHSSKDTILNIYCYYSNYANENNYGI